MATYREMQLVIADELGNRTDLLSPLSDSSLTTSPIKYAIQSAITKWEREPFEFNEAYSQPLFTTVASQEFYTISDATAIDSMPQVYVLHALINSIRYPLEKRSWEWMEEVSGNPTAIGQPTDWAYFARNLRLYPIPDGAYPIRASRITKVTGLSADADTNIWTSTAYDLIRSEAKLILAQEVLYDEGIAASMKKAIYGDPAIPRDRGYLGALKGEMTRRARSRIKATQF